MLTPTRFAGAATLFSLASSPAGARSRACNFDWSSKFCSASRRRCACLPANGHAGGAVSNIFFNVLSSVIPCLIVHTNRLALRYKFCTFLYLSSSGLRPNARSRAGASASRLSLPCHGGWVRILAGSLEPCVAAPAKP